jgi:hypothetical protein
MKGSFMKIDPGSLCFLMGELTYGMIEDHSRNVVTLVVRPDSLDMENWCDGEEVRTPSLMNTLERWDGAVYGLKVGDVGVLVLLVGTPCDISAQYSITYIQLPLFEMRLIHPTSTALSDVNATAQRLYGDLVTRFDPKTSLLDVGGMDTEV